MMESERKIKIECCSLELAQKLKKFGLVQDSLFYWIFLTHKKIHQIVMKDGFNETSHKEDMVSAYTTNELLTMIPQWITTKENDPFNNFIFHLNIKRIYIYEKLTRIYAINYHCDTIQLETGSPFFSHTLFKHSIYDEKLVDALAKSFVYLFENDFIKI